MQQVHATSATSKNENHNHGHGRRLYTTTDDCHSHGHVTANPPLQQQRQQQHQHQHQHQQKRKLQDCILSVPETFQALVSPIGFASPRLHPPKPSLASLQDPIQLDRYDSLWVMSIQPTPQAPHRQWSLTLLPLRHEQKVCTCSHPTLTFDSCSGAHGFRGSLRQSKNGLELSAALTRPKLQTKPHTAIKRGVNLTRCLLSEFTCKATRLCASMRCSKILRIRMAVDS